MIDRVIYSAKDKVVALKNVTMNENYFQGHFQEEKIMPGVVDIPQGARYTPDENGIDRGGNPNVLTKDCPSPGGAFPYNTCLVQVEKIMEK